MFLIEIIILPPSKTQVKHPKQKNGPNQIGILPERRKYDLEKCKIN